MIKKICFLFFIIMIFSTGCSKKNFDQNINTVIEENKNIIVGINYPTTGYKKIDNLIKNDVESIYNKFKDEYESFSNLVDKSELNIDYTYNILNDNYITILLNIYINSSKIDNKINYVKSYNYDIKKDKLLNINDIITKDKFRKVNSLTKKYIINNYKDFISIKSLNNSFNKYDNFSFDSEYLYIYFNPDNVNYNDIIEVLIPLKKININFNKKETLQKTSIPINNIVDVNKKVVALTFDDGPSKYTKDLIKVLKDNDAVGTFFILGNKVEIYSDTLSTLISNGNEIGNHSYNHKWLTKVDDNELKNQIDKTQNIIYNTLNYTPSNFRPTYGSINNHMRKNIDLNVVLWNVDTMDWKYKSVDKIVSRATLNTKDLDIILMHDTKGRTVEAVKKIIPILKNKGFTFVTVSELQEIKKLRNINEEKRN